MNASILTPFWLGFSCWSEIVKRAWQHNKVGVVTHQLRSLIGWPSRRQAALTDVKVLSESAPKEISRYNVLLVIKADQNGINKQGTSSGQEFAMVRVWEINTECNTS